ncbi:FAD-dependent oxidoreductase [Polluticaenibacter yanchengensis]|uniref:Flavin-dependent monooxygenase n=1 Tax=Polluticaenibacter yanchengensis TaxID=3014562 RepID=A0ABT4UI72_9BACT|nr:NAD(P)/FAD-dependent oxidoreductase [Chitinophagaceae bacterium LY-5]
MLLQNKKIAIVGGGPGGLTLARLLQLKGANVKVFERDVDKEARQQGATLDLHEASGLKALRQGKLMEVFYANYRPNAGKLRILDKDGMIHMDDHQSGNSDYAESRPEIDRAPLRNLLLQSLEPGTVIWNSQFTSMEKRNDGWMLQFKNGLQVYADIVIAADGANSKIRSYITDIQPVYSGITIIEGNIYNAEKNAPRLWELTKGGKIFALGDTKSLILSAKGEGSLSFYTGCNVAENWVNDCKIDFNNQEEMFKWFKTTFDSWNDSWQELFAGKEMWFVPRPQYHFPLDQSWTSQPGITLIGDAAHRMPPYAGEGVNMAMLDAFELAECLTGNDFPDVKTAISCYEKGMLKRASEVTAQTLYNTELMHSVNGLDNLLEMFENASH